MRLAGFVVAAGLCICPVWASEKLADGFEAADFAPSGGLYYKKNFEQSAGRVEFQSETTRSGRGALKLTVRPLCASTASDCSERAEVWERTALRVPYDRGVWYGFSVKFAEPIPSDDHRYLIAQWKRQIDEGAKGDFSPFLALRLRRGKLFATVETNDIPDTRAAENGRCGPGETRVWRRPETNQTRALVAADTNWLDSDAKQFQSCTARISVKARGAALPDPASGWIDFAVYTKPGPGGDGHIEIFANNEWIVTVTGRIGHADPGLGNFQYFKFGPYRAAHSTVWTMYYDDFRRSPDCRDVLPTGMCPF